MLNTFTPLTHQPPINFASRFAPFALGILSFFASVPAAHADSVIILRRTYIEPTQTTGTQIYLNPGGSSYVLINQNSDFYPSSSFYTPYYRRNVVIDSTLINPTLINPTVINSTIINPVILNEYERPRNRNRLRGTRVRVVRPE